MEEITSLECELNDWVEWALAGWTGREGWRLMERVVVRVERGLTLTSDRVKKTNQEETFIKNGKKGGSAQLINTQQLVRPQHDGWRWWRRKRKKKMKKKKVEMKWVYKWLGLFFSWFLEFDSFVFLVRVSSLRCGTVRAARWQRWWSSRRWWWLFFLSFLFTFHYNFEWMMWLLRAVVKTGERWEWWKKVYLWHFASSKVLKWRAQGKREGKKGRMNSSSACHSN